VCDRVPLYIVQSHYNSDIYVKTCRRGTAGYGLVGMVVLGVWLDSMILEVFSNL